MEKKVITYEQIKKLYMNEYGYITDIEDLVRFLEGINSLSLEDLNKILFAAIRDNNKLEKQNRIKARKKNVPQISEEVPVKQVSQNKPHENITSLFDVSSYYSAICDCSDLDFCTEPLPTIYDSNYYNIIYSLLSLFSRDLKIAEDLYNETKDSDAALLIDKQNAIINEIRQFHQEQQAQLEETEEQVLDDKDKRKIFFISKANDDSYFVDDDIDKITEEDHVLQILQKLENRVKMTPKRLKSNKKLRGLSEIRIGDSRVVYVELDKDTIVVVAILIKRFQILKPYIDMLETRNKALDEQRMQLLDGTKSSDFIATQANVLERTKKSLKSKPKAMKEGVLNV